MTRLRCALGAVLLWVASLPAPALALDPDALERFADDFFREALQGGRVEGAVFVVVDRDSVLLARGYGYQDVEAHRPMDPATSRFRVGSLSKFVTATVLMQLVERGLLSLHRDVRALARFPQLDAPWREPVTLAGLLTHTSGLDDRVIGAFARGDAAPQSLADHLRKRLPPRVLPPGRLIRYSNYGFALAGYLAELATSEPFQDLVAESLLDPLGMERSLFLVPGRPPPPDLVVGYAGSNGDRRRLPLDYFLPTPAGGFVTTGLDISRLMRAHLNEGRLGSVRILSPASVREMHAQQFTHVPGLPGVAYGLWERFENGRRALQHGGAWNGYSCLTLLLPEPGVGFFVAYDRFDLGLAQELASRFLDQHFPSSELPAVAAAGPGSPPAGRLAGLYRDTWYSATELDKLQSIFWQLEVRAGDPATLVVEGPFEPDGASRWRRASPLLFASETDDRLLSFRLDGDGRATHLFIGSSSYERIGWPESPQAHGIALALVVPLLASAVWRGLRRDGQGAPPAASWRWTGLVASLELGFLVGLGALLARVATSGGWELAYGVPPLLRVLLGLGALACLGAVALPAVWLRMLTGGRDSTGALLHHAAIVLAGFAFVALCVFYNLFPVHLSN